MNLAQTWRKWILAWVLLTFVSIQVIETTHHHESMAMQDACAICQLVAHQPLNAPPPATAQLLGVLILLYIISHRHPVFQIVESRYFSYFSRAPPHLTDLPITR